MCAVPTAPAAGGLRSPHHSMPAVADLEEEIPAAEFKKHYGGVGSRTYNNVVADIEARVASTPLAAPALKRLDQPLEEYPWSAAERSCHSS